MATPTNETGAPPDEPIDPDAWYGKAKDEVPSPRNGPDGRQAQTERQGE